MEKRYKTTGYRCPEYYLVECPKCKKGAIVAKTSSALSYSNIEIHCSSCMLKAKLEDSIFYQVRVKRNCPNCGKSISKKIDKIKEAPKEMSVICPFCEFKAEYIPDVSPYYYKHTNGLKSDPYFGYPLWLQSEVKGNLFWAYNREHLEEIRIFVESTLREQQSTYRMTMVARLPHFIKDHKNRALILKKIKELQEK